MPLSEWRMEEAKNLIEGICRILAADKRALPERLTSELAILPCDSTKLYCDVVEEFYNDSSRWSPDLPEYRLHFPEKCQETRM